MNARKRQVAKLGNDNTSAINQKTVNELSCFNEHTKGSQV